MDPSLRWDDGKWQVRRGPVQRRRAVHAFGAGVDKMAARLPR